MSHLGTWVAWKHARQQIDLASMIVDPHKTRGCVALPAEAAKVSCSNQNFVSQRQAFYKSGGLSLVPVRPWSRSGAIASWVRCDWWCDGGAIGGAIIRSCGGAIVR